jgi:hypothetical protein
MKTRELLKIAFRAGQNVETSGPILDDDAEFDEWFDDNQELVKKFDLGGVVGQSEQLPCELCGGSGFIHDDYIGTGICSCCDD